MGHWLKNATEFGDFRNWSAIETWTASIVQALKAPN